MVSECFGDLVILGYSVGDCCNVVGWCVGLDVDINGGVCCGGLIAREVFKGVR